ncbi:hypothetical protein J3D45_002944 [Microbacterium foliorum]|uniref:hypothetical protein n=1 Tax=Microbacterium foliorum TaxID=104336 RepID=UPI0020A218B6|nr:hypothetical protein [Microbacterium foliorum]MCP1430446.1 hypothetical protein [Microbacterium foliorum]
MLLSLSLSAASSAEAPGWAVLVTPVFTLIAAIGGVVVTGLFASAREKRISRENREHEIEMQLVSRQLSSEASLADRRLDAYTALIAEITAEPERKERKVAEAREKANGGGFSMTFHSTEISTALARAQLLSSVADSDALGAAVGDFHKSYSENVGGAIRTIVAIYRSESGPGSEVSQRPIGNGAD